MREQELRLAIVMTGGVSLAVYMFGVARELQKLARASRIYHGLPARGRAKRSYRDSNNDPHRETDTETIYFDLLQALAPEGELRVVIDVISGASAGGINGAMLARALAHDLPLDSHRTMWLENADVLQLMDRQAAARPWSKFWLEPVMRAALRTRLSWLATDAEARVKLSRFLRSRWFRPPFSGPRFVDWLLDACDAMSEGRNEQGSLLPDGHALDFFALLTDFHGYSERVLLNDPPDAEELEHRVLLHLTYERQRGGAMQSDFCRDAVPGLVFAARATSCFPGAFEAASIAEIDAVLEERGASWPQRETFMDRQFSRLAATGHDPQQAKFIDGAVVNNKPFAAALAALATRPAHRQVLRRILYIDPDPAQSIVATMERPSPGMFRAILASLAEIPRNEPVHDELERVAAINARIRLVRKVVAEARPQVRALVGAIIGQSAPHAPTREEIQAWRRQANQQAAAGAGFAFESYFRLKLLTVVGRLEYLLRECCRHGGIDPGAADFAGVLTDWLGMEGNAAQSPEDAAAIRERQIEFLRAFDADFRVRRLRLVIRRLNEFYIERVRDETAAGRHELDELKTTFYRILDETRRRMQPEFAGTPVLMQELAQYLAEPGPGCGRLLAALQTELSLVALDTTLDEIFAVMVQNYLPPRHRLELLTGYIGFSFFDVLTFPMMQGEDIGELEEVLIDRVSPIDARGIRADGAAAALKGVRLRNFGSFFSRAWRENDYLWGRLTSADRLVDIVLKAAGRETTVDAVRLKQRLFRAILDAERAHLMVDPALIPDIEAEIS